MSVMYITLNSGAVGFRSKNANAEVGGNISGGSRKAEMDFYRAVFEIGPSAAVDCSACLRVSIFFGENDLV